jgi:hypothetical protein
MPKKRICEGAPGVVRKWRSDGGGNRDEMRLGMGDEGLGEEGRSRERWRVN